MIVMHPDCKTYSVYDVSDRLLFTGDETDLLHVWRRLNEFVLGREEGELISTEHLLMKRMNKLGFTKVESYESPVFNPDHLVYPYERKNSSDVIIVYYDKKTKMWQTELAPKQIADSYPALSDDFIKLFAELRINMARPRQSNPFGINRHVMYMVRMTVDEIAVNPELTAIAKECVLSCKDLTCLETHANEYWEYNIYNFTKSVWKQKVIPFLTPSRIEEYLKWEDENGNDDQLENTIPTNGSFVDYCMAIAWR